MADSELRQRKPQGDDKPKKKSSKSKRKTDEGDDYTPWLDILRVLSFLFVASCGLSYAISGGESWFWGMQNKPNYLSPRWWKAQMSGPMYLTPEQLAQYDGSDPEKPLYLAINGTIYDVSNGRRMYGPGGSYSVFAGCDAARAYVTGCFAEDRTPDLRGVEEMFLPLDDPETDAHWTAAELEKLRASELEAARERMHSALKHWVDFFANSKKYHRVGYVKRDKDWLEKTPKRELCAGAQKGRRKRVIAH
ncbi:cytochrome b5-like Heme/Steroid binding domain-containing protein [Purpureocillium lilacinum]|uniref:Cytochrome b5-like Heme/Steroid binding domain-containing protein n=1 Tax=Purpureocillium lilacinum TaxID=33203 RepID=A0A179GQL2_PURLI|nr:cytochrome b5-like Heme/Steroid binding domain-containing protein [Purpureocillium lilacinum]KAK4094974.1 hypothetical protein Purlil1_670 [Purpureocillium lilacinum]OAQ80226.1 cytochrome b5-like Heme/Steroid binding domain-containing protein [Purpureocillium lilacinum]OAQ88370.1 cytochrome b5-like Heme/Steroid binding domain-containing protein [Purpureocillium lilacinum]PWI74127.1 hypothetical protein PCL_09403 [Purpureocillium lilacinum]GJN74468.1 hypothetical protein PLICBS_008559 [Purpu